MERTLRSFILTRCSNWSIGNRPDASARRGARLCRNDIANRRWARALPTRKPRPHVRCTNGVASPSRHFAGRHGSIANSLNSNFWPVCSTMTGATVNPIRSLTRSSRINNRRLIRATHAKVLLGAMGGAAVERWAAAVSSHSFRVGVAQDNIAADESLSAITQAYGPLRK